MAIIQRTCPRGKYDGFDTGQILEDSDPVTNVYPSPSWSHGALSTGRVVFALGVEPSHGCRWYETTRVAYGPIVLLDFKRDLATQTLCVGVQRTSFHDLFQIALLLDTLENSGGLNKGVAITFFCSEFWSNARGGDDEATGVEETTVLVTVLGRNFCVDSPCFRCDTVREDTGSELEHEIALFLFLFGDCVTGTFTFDVVKWDCRVFRFRLVDDWFPDRVFEVISSLCEGCTIGDRGGGTGVDGQ